MLPPIAAPDEVLLAREDIFRHTLHHFFAPVYRELFEDESVSEILINGPDEVYCERGDDLVPLPAAKFTERELRAAINNVAEFVHRRVDDDTPTMDARMPEPYRFRVHVILQPHTTRNKAVVSIRKFRRSNVTMDWLLTKDRPSLTPAAAAYLKVMVGSHRNLIVSGGTGSGKTSMLNALSEYIPNGERVVVIEDSAELQLVARVGDAPGESRCVPRPHAVYLEARPPRPDGKGALTIRDLFVNTLRMRPDRIVVGECRRGEALDLVQSMLSGHDGAMSTVHASNPDLALVRLETLCLMNETQLPVYVARTQVASAIHVIVQVARLPKHGRRVTAISEVSDERVGEKNPYVVRELFKFRPDENRVWRLLPTGVKSLHAEELRQVGTADLSDCGGVFDPPV